MAGYHRNAGWVSPKSTNGGGVVYYGVDAVGNPHFKNVTEAQILREDLYIRPEGDNIEVQVAYLLHNTSTKAMKNLHYAFPVDYNINSDDNSESSLKENIRCVEFMLNGKILSYRNERPLQKAKNDLSKLMRAWYFTTLDLPQGVSKLTVKYILQSGSNNEGDGLNKTTDFSYDFSPAATMGNGKITEFFLTIDTSDKNIRDILISNSYVSYIDEEYQHSQVCPLNEEDNVYRYSTSDFDLKNAEPLWLSFSHYDHEADIFIHSLPKKQFGIKTSSAVAQYPVSNLMDLNFSSVFVFDRKSDSHWIEISCPKPTAVYILPGYYKDDETYYNNNRIKEVLAEIISDKGIVIDSTIIELPDNPYKKLDYANFYESLASVFSLNYEFFDYDGDEVGEPVKVRVTILEVYKGRKYNDTCISELFVMADNDY